MITGDFYRKDRCYCDDFWNIENYDKAIADKEHTWICHHRLEINDDGTEVSAKELKERGLLYHRPACELIFVTAKQHAEIHKSGEKMKRDKHGKNNPMYGKHHSKTAKEKISKKRKTNTYLHGEHGYFVKGVTYDHK